MLYFHFYLALFLLLNLSWALSSRPLQRMLVVGDGDLSFSASIAENLAEKGISLVTSVLEDQKTHHQVYKESQTHLKYISSWSCHAIRFSIDATNLAAYFPKEKFNIVQFNFPHWRGKVR